MAKFDPRPVVLVVDDEADVRSVFTRILEFGGYNPVEAATGEAALALLEQGLLPAAVLLDFRMPGMDGHSFLMRLRADPRWFRIPVAVITGDSFVDGTIEANLQSLGAQVYFKPVNIDEILMLTTELVSNTPR